MCVGGGVSVQGGSVRGDLCLGDLCPGVLCPGGLCPGCFCPGGLCPAGSLSGGSLSRGSQSVTETAQSLSLVPCSFNAGVYVCVCGRGDSVCRGSSVWEISVQWGLCQEKSLSRGVFVQGVSVQGVFVQGVSVQGVSISDRDCPGQRPLRTVKSGR